MAWQPINALKGGYHAKKLFLKKSYLDFIGSVGLVDFLS